MLWLVAVAALMFLTLIVGGATRLTGSGLSIVEWKPVTGMVPPLDEPAWMTEFEKYKSIPQYRELNPRMSLDEFKIIYWWEWSHRILARLVGITFVVPFLWFLWRGWIDPHLRARLWVVFGLGAFLGAVGWWMVASGLTDRVSVSQYRLAFHMTLACAILAAVIWTVAGLMQRPSVIAPMRARASAAALIGLIIVQIYLGALVAGTGAGLIFNTWPLIEGSLVPDASRLFFYSPWWRNLFENAVMIQFNHRLVAYMLWLLAVLHCIDVACALPGRAGLKSALAVAAVVTFQAALGIATLVHQSSLALALTHQAMAIVVLAIAILHAERFYRRPESHAEASGADTTMRGGERTA